MLHPESQAEEAEQRFCRAKMLLADLLQLPAIIKELEEEPETNASKVYTKAPTLWLLVLQRLGGGLTLEQVVTDLVENHSDILPANRRVTEGKLSRNNSAYNNARLKLAIKVVEEFSNRICDHLARRAEPAFLDRRVFIIDGTTITLPPTPALQKAFPPASNQHGESVWPSREFDRLGRLRLRYLFGCFSLSNKRQRVPDAFDQAAIQITSAQRDVG